MKHLTSLLLFLFLATGLSAQVNDRLRAVLATEDAAVWQQNLRYLQRQPLSAYDGEAKAMILKILARPQVQGFPEYLLLAGFVSGEEALASLSPEVERTSIVNRYLGLAKIRGGNEERLTNLMKNVRQIELSDDFVYDVVPLLVYTRQREVFDYLWELIDSRNQACTTADAESTGRIDCAYRIVEYLGRAIEGFPVEVDEDHNLVTDDYAAALAEIRRWYAANRETYVINVNTY